MIRRVLLDPVVELLLDEEPSLNLSEVLSLHEAIKFLSRESHSPSEADAFVSFLELLRLIVSKPVRLFGSHQSTVRSSFMKMLGILYGIHESRKATIRIVGVHDEILVECDLRQRVPAFIVHSNLFHGVYA